MATFTEEDRAFIQFTLEQVSAETKKQGMCMRLDDPERGSITACAGKADRGIGNTVTPDMKFRIGSTSKIPIARLILREVDRGTIALTDRVSKFLPGIPNGDLMTVQHVLMMRSGVYDYMTNSSVQVKFTANTTASFPEPKSQMDLIRGNAPTFSPPDSAYYYTNANWILLGEILRSVTGRDWKDLVQNEVLTPLGMTETWIPQGTFNWQVPSPAASGYSDWPFAWMTSLFGPRNVTAWNPDLYGAAGMLTSTVGDLQKLAKAIRDGFLLTPAMQTLQNSMFQFYSYDHEGPTLYGYGLGNIKFDGWFGHDGSVPGYGSQCMYEPISGATLTGFENYQTPDVAIWSRAMRRVAKHFYPYSMA